MKIRFRYREFSLVIILSISLLVTALAVVSKPARAAGDSIWVQSGDPIVHLEEDNIPAYTAVSFRGVACDSKAVFTGWYYLSAQDPPTTRSNACIIDTEYGGIAASDFIKPKFEEYFAHVIPNDGARVVPYPGSSGYMEEKSGTLRFYHDTSGLFKKKYIPRPPDAPYSPYTYTVQRPPDTVLHWKDGTNLLVDDPYYSFSNNGEWLIANVGGISSAGMVKFNIASQQVSRMPRAPGIDLDTTGPLNGDPRVGTVGLAISNEGRYVVEYIFANAGDQRNRLKIIDTASCIDSQPDTDQDMLVGCSEKDYFPFLKDKLNATDHIVKAQFSTDAAQLTVYVEKKDKTLQRYTITANGYTDNKLDYLALGDSFSSGEGDTQNNPITGKRYYLPGTDVEEDASKGVKKEKCHISSRSYSFLLRDMMNLGTNRSASVACSGSTMDDVNNTSNKSVDKGGYRGRFKQYANVNEYAENAVMEAKTKAVNALVPGRAAQIQFVSTYRPIAVTLSLGGNDAGFAEKLTECVGIIPLSCSFTDPGDRRTGVGKEIQRQFDSLVKTYKKLTKASPSTKIFVVGYPILTDQTNWLCPGNVQLGSSQRQFVNEATKYMNQVIKAAAKAAGVGYIDVQDALKGHELCGPKNSFVTGLAHGTDIEFLWIKMFSQESYHPNALGQAALAQKVSAAVKPDNLLTYNYCANNQTSCPDNTVVAPLLSDYFLPDIPYTKPTPIREDLFNADYLQKDPAKDMKIRIYQKFLQPGSQAPVWAHSDPILLGTGTVDENGVLDMEVTIPNSIPVGQHEIHILAKSGGEDNLDLYTPLFIAGVPGDEDEDGIPDAQDKCLYVQPANIDEDEDGIDDGCDGNIIKEEVPFNNLYRARNGDPHKLDASVKQGQSPVYENAKLVYIERDINNAQRLKLYSNSTKDYDPDNDGWAVVAKTKDDMAGNFANIKTEKAEGKTSFEAYVPTVNIRSFNLGCISMTPQSLALVSENDDWNQRTLGLLAADTNTCRTQSAAEDVDKDGVADNIQQLYRARNGDQPTTWWGQLWNWIFHQTGDPNVYIERNVIAAEAQLGKSDYDSDNNGWAVVGKSDILQQGIVKRIEIVDQQPVVAVLSVLDTCNSFTPSSLATVKKDEQRKLVKYSGSPKPACSS